MSRAAGVDSDASRIVPLPIELIAEDSDDDERADDETDESFVVRRPAVGQ